MRWVRILTATMAGVVFSTSNPVACAQDTVTYEVIANHGDIPTADVVYNDGSQRRVLRDVDLPWRITVGVPNVAGSDSDGAEIRADWRRHRWRFKYVTVRIYHGGELKCESTLDVGNATCYGSTPHRSFPATGGG